jgi:tRNA(Ile)-lysidine synthase
MKPAELIQQVLDALGYPLHPTAIIKGDFTPLVVAVSGGPDSLALLHLLSQQGISPTDRVIAAHLDHAWRPSSASEAKWVANKARAWGLQCFVERADVAGLAREQGLTLEEAGRLARYHFLARIARQIKTNIVATAHTADDQAETVLMHLLRGSGLSGLRGMLPIAPLPGAPDLTLIRPLLTVTRADILAYCQEHNLTPIEDPSNADTTFFRNRLRHQLLPLLAQYNPQVQEHLQTLAAVTTADYALLDDLTRQSWATLLLETGPDWLRFDHTKWSTLPLSLRRTTLRHALSLLRPSLNNVGFRTIEQARHVLEAAHVRSQSILPGEITLTIGYHDATLSAATPPALPPLPQLPDETSLALPIPGRLPLANGWTLEATLLTDINLPAIQANRDPWLTFINGADLDQLTVRPRQPGERFHPLGMGGATATVKEVMINRKIPAALRPRWPIVATADHLIWLPGHHQDDRRKVTEATGRIIQLRALQ